MEIFQYDKISHWPLVEVQTMVALVLVTPLIALKIYAVKPILWEIIHCDYFDVLRFNLLPLLQGQLRQNNQHFGSHLQVFFRRYQILLVFIDSNE